MKNYQKITTEEILNFLMQFSIFGNASEFIRQYLCLMFMIKTEDKDVKLQIDLVTKGYKELIRTLKMQSANHTYDEDARVFVIPELLIIWDNKIERRCIEDFKDLELLHADDWTLISKKTFLLTSDKGLQRTIMYFEEIENNFYTTPEQGNYFQESEPKLMFFQLMFLNMFKKQVNNRNCNWPVMNQMFKGAFEELCEIPVAINIDTKRIFNFNHYLRQSREYNEIDDCIYVNNTIIDENWHIENKIAA
jgi:hypothetical protein